MMKISKFFFIGLSLITLSCVESSPPVEPTLPEGYTPPKTDINIPDEKPDPQASKKPVIEGDAIGSDLTLDVATWNIENFPKSVDTVSSLAEILNRWELDIVAIQEVQSKSELERLASEVDGFRSLISNSGDGRHQLGLIYDSEEIEILSQQDLFPDNRYAFPRPPFQVKFREIRTAEEITLISIHLKAYGDRKNQSRRIAANKILRDHIESLVEIDPDARIILLGDFNSQLDQEEMNPWTAEGSFDIATSDLFESNSYSYISGRQTLIDHIVTKNLSFDEVTIPAPYENLRQYEQDISDHLPIVGISY